MTRIALLLQLPLLALAAVLLQASSTLARVPGAGDWRVSNIVKNLELHGSVSQAITTYTIRPGTNATSPFFVAFSAQEFEKLAFADAIIEDSGSAIKAQSDLALNDEGVDPEDASTHLASVSLATARNPDEITLSVRAAFNHLTEPKPKTVAQTDPVTLFWQGDVGLRTPYGADKGRLKVATSSPKIPAYTPKDDKATKAGNKVTFGPYESIAPYRSAPVKQGSVLYEHNVPVTTIVTLDRVAEVSHWGDNLAIEDRIWLRNDGPALKGHFSRIDYQKGQFNSQPQAGTLVRFRMNLPAGASDAYFIDQIGNVSTSRFAARPPAPALIDTPSALLGARASTLEVQPRYPVLGGWNYTFSIGFNLELGAGGWGRRLGLGTYSVAVPFLTAIGEANAIDKVKTTIVLPEGATDVKAFLLFAVDSREYGTYVTYLDTAGRPSVILEKAQCSEKHSQPVYVQYRLSGAAHLRKPIAVTAVALGIFALAGALRRFDPKIRSQ